MGHVVGKYRLLAVAGVLLLAAVVTAVVLQGERDGQPNARPTVTWADSDGQPACVYDPKRHIIHAKIGIEGTSTSREKIRVTVTAHADENTSDPVGSGSRTVSAEGTMHRTIVIPIPVERAPHVDIDGVTACRLSVTYGSPS